MIDFSVRCAGFVFFVLRLRARRNFRHHKSSKAPSVKNEWVTLTGWSLNVLLESQGDVQP